jgi:broad specificity phosphatase PhoE
MRLYVVRHGHKAIAEPDFECAYNTPLSETGERQARHLGEFLAGEGLDCLYSSCELRALQTADRVHERVDVEWHAWPVFDEFGSTTWTERYEEDPESARRLAAWPTGERVETPSPAELAERDGNYYLLSSLPERYPVALSQPFPWPEAWWVPHENQVETQGRARVFMGAQALLARHDGDDTVAVVGHGNSGRTLVEAVTGEDATVAFSNTGVTALTDRDGWQIEYTDRTEHLPPELEV